MNINRHKHLNDALRLIQKITKESDDVQNFRYNMEPEYNVIINHIAGIYEEFENNDCLKRQREEVAKELEKIVNYNDNHNDNYDFGFIDPGHGGALK